ALAVRNLLFLQTVQKPKARKIPGFFVALHYLLRSKIPHVIPNFFSGEESAFPKQTVQNQKPGRFRAFMSRCTTFSAL
ncbi:MAG: hypothetical protein DMG92_06430, partial [Acidobacteria bacterium]